jgi:hypothetical protein
LPFEFREIRLDGKCVHAAVVDGGNSGPIEVLDSFDHVVFVAEVDILSWDWHAELFVSVGFLDDVSLLFNHHAVRANQIADLLVGIFLFERVYFIRKHFCDLHGSQMGVFEIFWPLAFDLFLEVFGVIEFDNTWIKAVHHKLFLILEQSVLRFEYFQWIFVWEVISLKVLRDKVVNVNFFDTQCFSESIGSLHAPSEWRSLDDNFVILDIALSNILPHVFSHHFSLLESSR